VSGRAHRFMERFGTVPDEPPREFIPAPWRVPVFVAMIVVGIVALALLMWLVVLPAVRQQAAGGSPSGSVRGTAPDRRSFSE
jgi:hypothetical protein